MKIKLPKRLEKKVKDSHLYDSFSTVLSDENKQFFFPEYTDHGIEHINKVLNTIEGLIAPSTFQHISSQEVEILVWATILHDIGMNTIPEMFKNMLDGKYDSIPNSLFKKDKKWAELWAEYLKDSSY